MPLILDFDKIKMGSSPLAIKIHPTAQGPFSQLLNTEKFSKW
jgi:hypothetical protein